MNLTVTQHEKAILTEGTILFTLSYLLLRRLLPRRLLLMQSIRNKKNISKKEPKLGFVAPGLEKWDESPPSLDFGEKWPSNSHGLIEQIITLFHKRYFYSPLISIRPSAATFTSPSTVSAI